jgi:predicted PurR-regulated permease PerM
VRNSLRELDSAANRLTQAQRVTQRPTRAAAASPASAPATFSDGAAVAFRETAVSGSSVLLKFAGDLAILLLIAFFLLSSSSSMAQRLVEQWSYHPSAQHRAETAVHQCAHQIRIYVGVLVVTNSIIGVVVWAVFSWAGLPDAAGWGVTAAVLHVIPYLGMGILMGFGAGEAFLAHGTVGAAIATAFFLLTLSTIVGTMVTAWLQGRAAKMNAAAVFIGLVFWGALWGVWGLFLGPALVVVMKTIAEHSRSGQRLALLMKG